MTVSVRLVLIDAAPTHSSPIPGQSFVDRHERAKGAKGNGLLAIQYYGCCVVDSRQPDLVSFADEGKKEHASSAVSTTTRRPAEVLREGSGIKVETTAGDGLTISRYNKDAGNPPYSSGLPGLIYHQRAQSSEFLLRAVTGTSFWPHGRMPI